MTVGRSRQTGRQPGRPRRDGTVPDRPPRDAIIQAATRLFAERGYAPTTITEIATAAGLQQSSIYYWFSGKEGILHATLALNREALELAEKLASEPSPAGVKLYSLLRYDTLQLCRSPFDFNEIERLAEGQPSEFADFWRDYRSLHTSVAELVTEGIGSGEFIRCDPALAASAALCLNEGLQKRCRTQARHDYGADNAFVIAQRTAEQYADLSASTTLRALLVRVEALADMRTSTHAVEA